MNILLEAPKRPARLKKVDLEVEDQLTTKEVCERLRVGRDFIRRHFDELGGYQLGPHSTRFPSGRVNSFLKKIQTANGNQI